MNIRYLSLLLVASLFFAGCEFKKNDDDLIFQELIGETIQDMAIDSNGDIWFITTEIDRTVYVSPVSSYMPVKFILTKYDHGIKS